MKEIILLAIFVASTFVGYVLIKNVPSLLHTPLMSGMNALSGITVLGAISSTAVAVGFGSKVFGVLALILAMINVVGGFGITDKMLRMFKTKKEDKKHE